MFYYTKRFSLSQHRGFTLIDLLAAILIFSFISMAGIISFGKVSEYVHYSRAQESIISIRLMAIEYLNTTTDITRFCAERINELNRYVTRSGFSNLVCNVTTTPRRKIEVLFDLRTGARFYFSTNPEFFSSYNPIRSEWMEGCILNSDNTTCLTNYLIVESVLKPF